MYQRKKKSSSYSIKPKKSLGQNFLIDQNIVKKIIGACDLKTSDSVLEIGPGLGALTREIVPCVNSLVAIETDRALHQKLKTEFRQNNVKIVHADVLRYNFDTLQKTTKVIGNLPYNISSPIIERIIRHRSNFTSAFITVQWEFGKRMTAHINSKAYSALTLFVQYYTNATMLFKIKNSCFKPAPKVLSCFMRLDIRHELLNKANNEEYLWKIVRLAFQQRRKTILNALSRIIDKTELAAILSSQGVNIKSRAENLTLKNFINIANRANVSLKVK